MWRIYSNPDPHGVGSGEDLKKKIQYIFTLSLLSPLGEGLSPFFEQT
jgi:hypothetical protein